jgi:hypothetical protein
MDKKDTVKFTHTGEYSNDEWDVEGESSIMMTRGSVRYDDEEGDQQRPQRTRTPLQTRVQEVAKESAEGADPSTPPHANTMQ